MNEILQIKCQCEVSQQTSRVHMSRRYPEAMVSDIFMHFVMLNSSLSEKEIYARHRHTTSTLIPPDGMLKFG